MVAFGRLLVIMGIVIALVGAVLWLAGRTMPWLGHLPGDIRYESDNVKIYFPLATMILISLIGTIVLNIIVRWLNR